MRNKVGAVALTVLSALAAMAADASGKWIYAHQTQGRVTLNLKTDGGRLTGTVSTSRRGEVAISDGKVDGNHVTFSDGVARYEGTVEDDTLKLNIEHPRGNISVMATLSA